MGTAHWAGVYLPTRIDMHTNATPVLATFAHLQLLQAAEKTLCTLVFLSAIAFTSIAIKLIIEIA